MPVAGETVHGFTLESAEYSSLLDADILSFTHEYSGAQLVYVKNSDPEKAFAFSRPLPDGTTLTLAVNISRDTVSLALPGGRSVTLAPRAFDLHEAPSSPIL